MKKIDARVGQKFALAAGMLMTRLFSSEPRPNPRRLMFACGPAMTGARFAMPTPDLKFEVPDLGFRAGREWGGPSEIFVENTRDDELPIWTGCQLYASTKTGPTYVLMKYLDVCFSYDGNALVTLPGSPGDRAEGAIRAKALLREAARRLPDGIEHTG